MSTGRKRAAELHKEIFAAAFGDEWDGVNLHIYAGDYTDAVHALADADRKTVGFDPTLYQLSCQALELHLKAFLWLADGLSSKQLKNKYGHDLAKLWEHGKARGIGRYAKVTQLRDRTVKMVSTPYKNRQFAYLDPVSRVIDGDQSAIDKIVPTLRRLNEQLSKSMDWPLLKEKRNRQRQKLLKLSHAQLVDMIINRRTPM